MVMKKGGLSVSNETQIKPAEVAKQIRCLLKELPEPRADAARLDELRRVFTHLCDLGELAFTTTTAKSGAKKNSVAAKWFSFLHNSHEAFVSQLCDRVKLGRHASVRCLWGVIAGSPRTSYHNQNHNKGNNSQSSSSPYRYVNIELLEKWMLATTLQESTEMEKSMRHLIEAELLRPYRDVQHYSLGVITKIATSVYNGDYDHEIAKSNGNKCIDDDDESNSGNKTRVAGKLLELLMMIPVLTSEENLEGSSHFLFPPPSDAVLDDNNNNAEENEDETEEDDDDEDSDNDSDNDDSSSYNENSENEGSSLRPNKRQKMVESTSKFASQQVRLFRREYRKAWLAVLMLPLPMTSLKRALNFLPKNVLNYVSQPLRFADFFMQAYSDNSPGIIGVLALEGLFLLITKYGLEYSNFYAQLYKLVSARVMYAKYRARFFSLMTKCLVLNAMLPAHLVAAFIKRLCRCALSGPPSGALFVLALVSNLLKKHPECSCLVQRKGDKEREDSFLADEDDPVECRALQSSLWELAVLERHYYPAVATLAKSIGRAEEDKAPLYNVEEFAAHTYGSLFDQEKKKKNKTALAFKKPTSLFTEDDIFSGCIQIGDK
mmetsp:Transcript_61462/g.69648  ORF Transcript_61462/g.69648 Transcript_61462/m.69648 type:complete len:604 (-) Transcript_61462:83-1894(-)